VTHDAHVAEYSDRMIHLKDGEIIEDTMLKTVSLEKKENPKHDDVA